MGYITKKLIAIDGCKLKANASKKFTGDYEIFQKKKLLYEKMIVNLLKRSQRVEERENAGIIDKEEADKEIININRLEKNYSNSLDRIDNFLKDCKDEDKKKKINLTDKDSGLMQKGNKYFQGYNCQIGVNDNGILVMNDVLTSASDRGFGEDMVRQSISSLKENNYSDNEINKITFLLDKGYNDSSTIGNLLRDDYNILIPFYKRISIDEAKKISREHCKIWKDDNCCYLECPGGITKTSKKAVNDRGIYFYKFFFNKSECKKCKYFMKCSGLIKNEKKFNVKREVLDNALEVDILKTRMDDIENIDLYNKRLAKAESVFGITTDKRGFNSFFVRGKEKVKCYWSMVSSVYNLRRIHSLTYS